MPGRGFFFRLIAIIIFWSSIWSTIWKSLPKLNPNRLQIFLTLASPSVSNFVSNKVAGFVFFLTNSYRSYWTMSFKESARDRTKWGKKVGEQRICRHNKTRAAFPRRFIAHRVQIRRLWSLLGERLIAFAMSFGGIVLTRSKRVWFQYTNKRVKVMMKVYTDFPWPVHTPKLRLSLRGFVMFSFCISQAALNHFFNNI